MKKPVVYMALLSLLLSSCNSDYSLCLVACDESEGVQETVTPVTLNGKYIGDVDNIIPTGMGIMVPITINDGLKIPANSIFTIIDGKAFGTKKQIAIKSGSSEMYLHPGDTIKCSPSSAIKFNKIPSIYGCNK